MSALLLAGWLTLAGGAAPEAKVCIVQHWPEARYRAYAYDHYVHVSSTCGKAIRCIVRTNVNPTPIKVTVPPRSRIEVLTFKGSPHKRFTPSVKCK